MCFLLTSCSSENTKPPFIINEMDNAANTNIENNINPSSSEQIVQDTSTNTNEPDNSNTQDIPKIPMMTQLNEEDVHNEKIYGVWYHPETQHYKLFCGNREYTILQADELITHLHTNNENVVTLGDYQLYRFLPEGSDEALVQEDLFLLKTKTQDYILTNYGEKTMYYRFVDTDDHSGMIFGSIYQNNVFTGEQKYLVNFTEDTIVYLDKIQENPNYTYIRTHAFLDLLSYLSNPGTFSFS